MVDLVKMKKGDKFADVHPNEVENYKIGDWAVYEEPKKTVSPAPSRAKVSRTKTK